jgi:hypothetical protein
MMQKILFFVKQLYGKNEDLHARFFVAFYILTLFKTDFKVP